MIYMRKYTPGTLQKKMKRKITFRFSRPQRRKRDSRKMQVSVRVLKRCKLRRQHSRKEPSNRNSKTSAMNYPYKQPEKKKQVLVIQQKSKMISIKPSNASWMTTLKAMQDRSRKAENKTVSLFTSFL